MVLSPEPGKLSLALLAETDGGGGDAASVISAKSESFHSIFKD